MDKCKLTGQKCIRCTAGACDNRKKVSEKLTDKQKQVILEMCENDMKIVDVAMALSLSTSTVRGHLNRIHTKTGMNPRCFYDLVELMDMVREG